MNSVNSQSRNKLSLRHFYSFIQLCRYFNLFYAVLLLQMLIFLLTLVFILLTIGFAQEIQGVKTSLPYLASTLAFYLATDPLFVDLFTKCPLLTKIELFECRETTYGRLGLKIIAIFLASAINIALLVITIPLKTCNDAMLHNIASADNSEIFKFYVLTSKA